MSIQNDGGPAFPTHEEDDQRGYGGTLTYLPVGGMSLRDYLAAKAMQASRSRNSTYKSWAELATDAYEIADAMLAARKKTEAP